MGKVFDAVKHLLVEESSEDKKEEEEKDKHEQKNEVKVEDKAPVKELEPAVVKPTISEPETGTDKDAEALSNKLIQTVTGNAGDYLKFSDMVESLRSMLPDERTCFKAAFTAVSKTSPMTAQSLVTSLEGSIKALDNEVATFQNTMQGRQTDIDGLRRQVQEKSDQIVKLQNEIKELLAKMDEESRKNEQVGLNFDRAVKSAKYNFESLITKVNSYLGGDKNDGTA